MQNKLYYSHFKDEGTKAQRSEVMCAEPLTQCGAELV